VLVVDDDLDQVQSMALLLKDMGHVVDFAITGVAALEVARRFRPDVVFLELTLPDIDGVEVAKQLRTEPGLQSARIISVIKRKPLDAAVLLRLLEAG